MSRRITLCLVAILVGLVAACGEDGGDEDPPPETPPPATTAGPAPSSVPSPVPEPTGGGGGTPLHACYAYLESADWCTADVEDYDCAGSPDDGPEYVEGPVQLRIPGDDPFDLDRDDDGEGCEEDETREPSPEPTVTGTGAATG